MLTGVNLKSFTARCQGRQRAVVLWDHFFLNTEKFEAKVQVVPTLNLPDRQACAAVL